MNGMASGTSGRFDGSRARPWTWAVVGLAIVLQLIVLVPFTIASGLVAPLWAVALLYGLWLVGAGALLRLARRRPLLTPLVPVVNALVLWLAITGGEHLLGWTA